MESAKKSESAENIADLEALQVEVTTDMNAGPVQPQTVNPVKVDDSVTDLLQPVLLMGFAVLAPNWQVTQPEVEQLSTAYGALIEKYFPNGKFFDEYSVEISAIMVTGMVVVPKMSLPRKTEIKEIKNATNEIKGKEDISTAKDEPNREN